MLRPILCPNRHRRGTVSSDDHRSLSRRDALATLAVGGVALVASCKTRGHAPSQANAPASALPTGATIMPFAKSLAGTHEVAPLPFKPGALNGISEKLITSHHDNNYAGAVKNLNKVELQLSQLTSDTPPFVVAGLH